MILGVGLIGVSPLALDIFGGPTGHWERLNYIGGMYANMIISQWQMSYETRSLAEPYLRFLAREFFAGTIGRDFWALARDDRLSTSETRRIHRFHQILDEEYQASLATPAIPRPASAPDSAPGRAPGVWSTVRSRRRIPTLLAAVAAAAGIAAIVRALRRTRRQ